MMITNRIRWSGNNWNIVWEFWNPKQQYLSSKSVTSTNQQDLSSKSVTSTNQQDLSSKSVNSPNQQACEDGAVK